MKFAVVVIAGALALVSAPVAEAAQYKSCAALNKQYPHGVGKTNATDKVRGYSKPVTNFTRNDRVYWLYSSSNGERVRDLDRDNDGVACERR